jgi:hypothetical protein
MPNCGTNRTVISNLGIVSLKDGIGFGMATAVNNVTLSGFTSLNLLSMEVDLNSTV